MSVIITTSDSEEIFASKEEVKFQAVPNNVEGKTTTSSEKTPEDSAPAEKEGNESDDKSFDYLNSTDEDSDQNQITNDEDDADDEDGEQEVGTQPKKSGFKKRIDKLISKNSEFEQKILELEQQIKNGKTPNNTQQEQNVPEYNPKEFEEPSIDDFDEYSNYVKALAKYEINKEKAQLAYKQEEELIRKEAESITLKYRERIEEAKARYGAEKWMSLSKVELPLTTMMRSEIMNSEIGPDILYYLCHNIDEGKRIINLSEAGQVKELTKLEIKIMNKLGKNHEPVEKVSKAPSPVKPINSKTDGRSFRDPDKLSFQEYKAWRAEQESKRK